MRTNTCQACGKTLPVNDTFTVFGRTLCKECAEASLAGKTEDQVPEGAVHRNFDPTVCSQCGRDYGQKELATVAGLPACPGCRNKFVYRPFPVWVQISLAAVLLLAGIEMARNWRLFQAYIEIPRAHKAMEEGDIEKASALFASAAAHVPESHELATEEMFCRGLCLMRKGNYTQAQDVMLKCRTRLPAQDQSALDTWLAICRAQEAMQRKDYAQARQIVSGMHRAGKVGTVIDELLDGIEIAIAFDAKDYDKFLAIARKTESQAPADAQSAAQVASALACKYAVTGQETFKQECMNQLAKARELSKENAAFKEYEERILYRLKTREIIEKEEYDRRFRQNDQGATK